jgi:hypothetical protein
MAKTPIETVARRGRHNDLTDVAGIRVGHFHRTDADWLTGTTVVIPPAGTVGGVDVRGGGPSTRETDALAPTTLVDQVHAICLSGGSSYGLAAAAGVMDALAEQSIGFPVGPESHMVVPIVPAACLFDVVGRGNFYHRPDATFGRAAFEAATSEPTAQGNVGAGAGGLAGFLKGGIGSASVVLPNGVTVAALAAVNCGGNVVDLATGQLYGAPFGLDDEFTFLQKPSAADCARAREALSEDWPRNTILVVVATDADLTKTEACRVSMAAHDGLARAVTPVHCLTDGDVVFTLATQQVALSDGATRSLGADRVRELDVVMAAGANAVTRAVVHAVLSATSSGPWLSYLERYPSAQRS